MPRTKPKLTVIVRKRRRKRELLRKLRGAKPAAPAPTPEATTAES